MRHLHSIFGLSSLLIATIAISDARADYDGRFIGANATSHCQTALPVFDGNVRKRPLMVQNEGDGDAFVTCSFTAQGTELYEVRVFFWDTDTAQQTPLSCTAVTGHRRQTNEYVTKTANQLSTYMWDLTWDNEDFGTPNTIPGSGLFSITCKLPPGTGIGNAYILIYEDIGN